MLMSGYRLAVVPVTELRGPHMDDGTLTELIRDFGVPLRRYVSKLTVNDAPLAEDVVQETLVRAWQRPHIVNNRYSSIRPWLFTVARNLVNDHWRARKARPTEVSETELAAVAEERDQIDETVRAHAMRQAMARLSAEHREVLAQVHYRSLSIVDAAEALGIPAGTVKSRTYYALRSLRMILDELGITDDPT
jgi:RNA polymerase sigma-70 factor (ECF subfamily)